MESQVKLLRLLQEGKYYPLGEDVPKLTDARIIVATNRDIDSLMKAETFRRDLYYRLQTHHIHLPPLRDRPDDLPLLVEHFLDKAAKQLDKNKPMVPAEFFTLLGVYHFPGNIRELESMIFDAISRHKRGVLSMKSFKAKIGHQPPASQGGEAENGRGNPLPFTDLLPTLNQLPALKDAEQLLIAEALKRSDGNQTIAARLLGMSRQALHNRLSRAR
jgi:DNA-binding NtrC family response regulator